MNKFCVLALLSAFALSACDKSRLYEENKEIPNRIWKQSEPLKYEAEIKDTVGSYNVFINVRNAGGYQFSNLFLFIKTSLPKGQQAADTMECTLADNEGKWLGSGLGDIYDNQILFKRNMRFPQAGKYTFVLEQAMRIDPLPMIMDVGIRIEKASDKR